jgi:LPS sulfotransferase NodH
MTSRPDILDLIGPEFDSESVEQPKKTLLICAAPRSGSYEMCRLLTAAGVGVPHEYFNPNYARQLADRWDLGPEPLAVRNLGRYIDTLRCRRSAGEVFGVKLMYPQFNNTLRNRYGAALLDSAIVIHLFRPDAVAQYESLHAAAATGRWDFSAARTTEPRPLNREKRVEEALSEIDALMTHDSSFRKLFVLLDIRPMFVTADELFGNPAKVIHRIADAVGAKVNGRRLAEMLALSKRYLRDGSAESETNAELKLAFRKEVFPV